MTNKGPARIPVTERIWSKVNIGDEGECWNWAGSSNGGYGQIGAGGDRGKTLSVHRVVYESMVGPIPAGLTIDHLCRNPLCVNPKHLEAVTQRVNVLRGTAPTAINARKTHCKWGHPFDENNTGSVKNRWRYCLRCSRSSSRAYRQKKGKTLRGIKGV